MQRLFTANNETSKQHLQQVLLSNNEAADKKWDARIDTMEQNMKQHVQQLREDFEKLVAQLEHRVSPDRKKKETFSKLKRKRIDGQLVDLDLCKFILTRSRQRRQRQMSLVAIQCECKFT